MRRSVIVLLILMLASCQQVIGPGPVGDIVAAPKEIRNAALKIAREYEGVPYEWGGQSAEGMDCSGLIVRAYERAVEGTQFALLFEDAAVVNLLNEYTKPVERAKPGDVLFMGENDITHAALFVEKRDGRVWFIDAFSTSGVVAVRSYESGYYKFKETGRLLVEVTHGD